MSTQPAMQRIRQNLQPKGRVTIPKGHRIQDPEKRLPVLLKEALMVEHMTIPTYLCALYSINDGYNVEAAQIIKSVVLEEMLHMILAANVLNAIGGTPCITDPQFIPTYPNPLPHSDGAFTVNLQKFSKDAIRTFLKIERPAKPLDPPEGEKFHTLSQFYEAIELVLLELSGIDIEADNLRERVDEIVNGTDNSSVRTNIFTKGGDRQVRPEHYYGGGGEAIPVTDLRSALRALHEITGQGEGVHHTIWDGDEQLGEVDELAHYFRFNEIYHERRYTRKDTVRSRPSGEKLVVHWEQVYPMQPNPKMAHYPQDSELWKKTYEFNRTYSALLNELNTALSGEPQLLMQSVVRMYDLKYQAVELMKLPIGKDETTAGPSFEYVE